MSLDIYAKSYVPAWLLKVNEYTEDVHHLHLPNQPEKSPSHYVASFSGTDVWKRKPDEETVRDARERAGIEAFKDRAGQLRRCLAWESEALVRQADEWTRYNVTLSPVRDSFGSRTSGPGQALPSTQCYQCLVPGLAEYTPPALLHDPVELRQLVPHAQSFDGLVIHGRVVAVKRARSQVFIECLPITIHSGLFNVKFPHNGESILKQDGMLAAMAQEGSVWLSSYIAPELKDCKLKTQLTQVRKFNWKDSQLNLEQMKAVQEIHEQRYGDLPYLIQGPPGTGKTKTVVEAILQILELNPDARIIACGPSNTAADTIALRLARHLVPDVLLRLNGRQRSFEEVPEPLLPYSSILDDSFALPEFRILMSKRVVVATTTELLQLHDVKCDNPGLEQFETFVMNAMYPNSKLRKPKAHFTHLFVDEAGQATEAEILCALAIVEPRRGQRISVTLAGDHKQLGPRIFSPQARDFGFDHSLLERLLERPCYADHPLARGNLRRNPRPKLPFVYPAFANLYRNYRSHPTIIMVPSQLSYDSSLSACAQNVDSFSSTHSGSIPVRFIAHEGQEEAADVNAVTSWYNPSEIEIITEQVQEVMESSFGTLKPQDIAIMAPYREQVVRLRLALRKVQLSAVTVGTVEDYQGAEARVVIISVVRTQVRFLKQDKDHGVGILHEPRRSNVALTRAKELLIVVGNPVLMWDDNTWKNWLLFCKRNGTYTGLGSPEHSDEFANEYVPSSLENAFHDRQEHRPSLGSGSQNVEQYSDQAMLLAGDEAQEILDNLDF